MKTYAMLLLLFIGVLCSGNCFSQASIALYSDGVLGISTSQDRLFSGELKFFSNAPAGQLELDGFVNFKKKPFHQFSLGFGLHSNTGGYDIIDAVTMPLRLTFFPFQDSKSSFVKRLSLALELCPEYYPNHNSFGETLSFRRLCGIRYKFSD
jgi:hypothetical protein